MRWAFSFCSVLLSCFILSCADHKVENARVSSASGNVLTSIGNRVITVNDYIKRCEYVPRPNYCKNNNYIHKKIALNSLIAEKLLALEFEKKKLNFTNAQNSLIAGRKEQSMRQMMLKVNGFDKVQLDSGVVDIIAKQSKRTYEVSFLILNTFQKKQVSEKRITSLANIQYHLSDIPAASTKLIGLNDEMPDEVKNILFFSKPAKNFLYGPVSLSKEKHMFFEVSSWNTLVSVTDEQKKQAYLDAEKTYRESTALKIYKKYVSVLMSQKELVFDPEVFQVFSDRMSKIYLIEKEKKESVIQNTIWNEETKSVDDSFSFNDLKILRKEKLLTFDNEKFSIGNVLDLIKKHPLVFRNRNVSSKSFSNELKYALVDLFRDREITEKAYSLGYDKQRDIVNVENKWKDFISSSVMKNVLTTGLSDKEAFIKLSSKVDSLQKLHSNIIKIDTDKFEQIKLTSIDMNVIYTNQAYPLIEPSFPILTDDHVLDYGQKHTFN
tara:strand:+ start:1100 stop:2581 length:1482 start_codon:yes stop_codon:yes gene_type:complete